MSIKILFVMGGIVFCLACVSYMIGYFSTKGSLRAKREETNIAFRYMIGEE